MLTIFLQSSEETREFPFSRSEVFWYSIGDRQSGVEVEVFQVENTSCTENTLIGSFFYPLKPAPARSPVIVEFAYDLEGLVRICLDQKGYDNRKEVTLDIRNRKVEDAALSGSAESPVNYIAEKARRLASEAALGEHLRRDILRVASEYEAAIRTGEDEDRVDELKDQLLAVMEQAEEVLEPGE